VAGSIEHSLRDKLGLKVRVYEEAETVGGT
jgi:hypothetical protein